MKPVPVLRTVTWLVVFGGGIAAGFFLKPPVPAAQAAASSGQNPDAAAVAEAAEKSQIMPPVSFDGTPAGLVRIAKSAAEYTRMRVQLYLVLQPLPAAQIAALTEAFPWVPNHTDYENAVWDVLLDQWAVKDIDAALRWAAALPAHRSKNARLQLFLKLAGIDPDKALALARRITPASERDNLVRSLTYTMAGSNPRRALDMMLADGAKSKDYIPSALGRWAQDDPAGAFAKAMGLPNNRGRNDATQSVLAVWAKTDPAAAREAALSLPEGRTRQNALASVFNAWASDDPAAAHAAALKMSTEKERRVALQSVINGWCSVDPPGAVQAIAALPRSMKMQNMLNQAYNSWAAQDPVAAAAGAQAQQLPKALRNNVFSNIAATWAQNDPTAAMAWARGLPPKEGGAAAVSNVMSYYAQADGPAAAALWQTLPKEQRRTNLSSLVATWAYQDSDAALQFAHTLENRQERVQALVSVSGALDIEKPETISAVLKELPAGQMRVEAISNIFSQQSQQDSTRALQWLRTLPENERTAVLNANAPSDPFGYDGSNDPEEMKTLLESTPGLTDYYNLWANTASSLASKDPAGALAWAQGLESSAGRRQSIGSVLRQWANEDPAAALAAARALPDADTRKEVLPGILDTWARQDADAVLAWADTVSGPEREAALVQGSLIKADNDPVVSAAAIESLLTSKGAENAGSLLNTAAAQVAESWFRQDIGQATAWALQLPAGTARESAIGTLTSSWARLDPVAASEWVSHIPAGGDRDVAAGNLSQAIQNSDPERAFVWATSIANESKRDEAVRNAANSWMWQDRQAARAAIERAPVSENVRTALLEQLNKRD